MRQLTMDEINSVNGGISIVDSVGIVGGAGAALGIIATDTAFGAANGEVVGSALGFSFSVGYAIGSYLSDFPANKQPRDANN